MRLRLRSISASVSCADEGAAAEEAALEMPLLVGEGHHVHRQAGASEGQRRHHAQRAIQPAGVVLRLDMAADQQMRAGAGMAAEHVADAVHRGGQAAFRHAAPSASGGIPCPAASRSGGGRRSCRRRSGGARAGRAGSGRVGRHAGRGAENGGGYGEGGGCLHRRRLAAPVPPGKPGPPVNGRWTIRSRARSSLGRNASASCRSPPGC